MASLKSLSMMYVCIMSRLSSFCLPYYTYLSLFCITVVDVVVLCDMQSFVVVVIVIVVMLYNGTCI